MSNTSEQAVVYASLILQDDNVEITADKIQTLVKAAGVDVELIWASIFAKALEGKDLGEMLMNVGAGGAAPAAGAAAATGGAAAAAEEEKEEEKEESDDDMGFGLFD
ncbi:60s acidic ribosomal protein-domain-containing protein [Syncephalis fuscata]|nr:60s acidic ribosomal protein-domain-containing protein [Syncephalis fuscata]